MNRQHFIAELAQIYSPGNTEGKRKQQLKLLIEDCKDSRDFKLFVRVVRAHAEAWEDLDVQWLLMMADSSLEDSERTLLPEMPRPYLRLFCEQVEIKTIEYQPGGQILSMNDIEPATYRLELDTGLLIWQDYLDQQDLLWPRAFPGQALDMAADSGGLKRRFTKRKELFKGAVIVLVYPGLESGTMNIEIQ